MSHPGDGLNNTCPRNYSEAVLVLEGRRSVVAWWPDTAVCEKCQAGKTVSGGYVGPVVGDKVVYPDPATRFVCRTCARAMVGLGENELTGHMCQTCPNDTLHVDRGYHPRGAMEDLTDDQRVQWVTDTYDYPDRGWSVIAVKPAYGLPATTGTAWEVWFHAAREAFR
ncbi:hypothetical protein KDK95_23305 [Actinospica sp. MGRD01-02]|uniref:Uncharacterized protein n=1 Tax=Actinospica acidithermotolerans TaxID=2828514 RepID=A0A941EEW8_9ACTN|nr:hypothetical protein [Actinospica acidithermotolerans]MBR7829255.1 hypothetical protein [Actinospica acidithermotolerans]